jgi:hypothetical protein
MTDFISAAMWAELSSLLDEEKYETFLREKSLAKDHSFLLYSIGRSNLRPSVRKVLEELIRFGKLRRPKHRPRRDPKQTHMIGLRRALCVLDLEAEGWEGKSHGADEKRKCAIREASKRLCCGYDTVEKDFYKYQSVIKCLDARDLNDLREILASVFK